VKPHAWRFIAVVAATSLVAACYEQQSIDTVIHRDGTVDRAIVQHEKFTPMPAQSPGLWRETRTAKAGPISPWDGTIAALPPPVKADEEKFFAARGRFRSIADIPDHYAELAVDGAAASRLARTYTERDLGMVTERQWTETLNDIVNPTEMALARDELAGST
jgi:hypothetical protein